jgi:hypothetical protein
VPRPAQEGDRGSGTKDAGPGRGGSGGATGAGGATSTVDASSGGASGGNGPAGEGGNRHDLDAGLTTDAGSHETAGDIVTPRTADQCATDPTQRQPLVAAPGETCYEFPVHGVSSPTDQSKFTIPTGHSINQFYYAIPWPAGTLATRFGARFDNVQLLHRWFAFGISSGLQAAGSVQRYVTGTTLGQGAELIGAWAVGDCNVTFPKNMGLKLPDTGQIMIQWEHDNGTGNPGQDGTTVQFCTVPAGSRPDVGGLTFLGTENFNGIAGLQAGQVSKFSGTCQNDSGKPITIVGYNPQMGVLGTNMTSVVAHINGVSETVFDHPFRFDRQVNYLLNPGYVLQPGDKVTSTCTFGNATTEYAQFDQSSEMCGQLVFAYPHDALGNGVISLLGATNICW